VIQCSGDGLSAVSTTPCPSGQHCRTNACYPVVCTPSTYYCSADEKSVLYCDTTGTYGTPTITCSSTAYCNANYGGCVAQVCVPGTVACTGDTLGVCNAAGSRVLDPTTNCTDSGQVCLAGACTSAAVESVGSATYGSSLYVFVGDAFQPTIPRLLTEFAVELGFTGARTLNFVVYEGDPGGTLSQISTTTVDVTGTGRAFYSSGALSISLQVGKSYLFGVGWPSGIVTFYYGSSTANTSFARVTGSYVASTATPPLTVAPTTGSSYYSERVTTAAPL
jgi:hypothetical protein